MHTPKAPEHLSTQNFGHSCRGTRRGEKPVPSSRERGWSSHPTYNTIKQREAAPPSTLGDGEASGCLSQMTASPGPSSADRSLGQREILAPNLCYPGYHITHAHKLTSHLSLPLTLFFLFLFQWQSERGGARATCATMQYFFYCHLFRDMPSMEGRGRPRGKCARTVRATEPRRDRFNFDTGEKKVMGFNFISQNLRPGTSALGSAKR